MIDGGPQSPTPEENSSHDPEKAQAEVAKQILSKANDKSSLSEIDSMISALKTVVRDLPNMGPEIMEKVRNLLARQKELKNAPPQPDSESAAEEPVKAKSEPKRENEPSANEDTPQTDKNEQAPPKVDREQQRSEENAQKVNEALRKTENLLKEYATAVAEGKTFTQVIGLKIADNPSKNERLKASRMYLQQFINVHADYESLYHRVTDNQRPLLQRYDTELRAIIIGIGEMEGRLLTGIDSRLRSVGTTQPHNEKSEKNENEYSEKFINDFMQELRNLSANSSFPLEKIQRSLEKIFRAFYPNVPQWIRNLRTQFEGDAQSLKHDPWFGPSLYDFKDLGLDDSTLAESFTDLFNDVMRTAQGIEQLNMQRSLDAALDLTSIANIQQFSVLETKIPRTHQHLSLHMLREYRQAVKEVQNAARAQSFEESDFHTLKATLGNFETLGQEFKDKALEVARIELNRRKKEQTIQAIVPQIEAASDINAARKLLIDNGLGYIQDVVLNIMNIFVSHGKEQMRKQQFPHLTNVTPSAIRDMWNEIKDHKLKQALQKHFDAYAKEVFENWMETRQKNIAKEREALITSLKLTLATQIERKLAISDEYAGLLPEQQIATVRANLLTKYTNEIDKLSAETKFADSALDQIERWVEESKRYSEMTLSALAQVKIGNYALELSLGKLFTSLRDEVESFTRSVSFMKDKIGHTGRMEFLADKRAWTKDVPKEVQQKVESVLLTRLMAQRVDHPVFAERHRVATAYGTEQPAYMMYPSKLGASDWKKAIQAAIESVSQVWGIDITQVTESSKDILLPKIHESLIQLLESAVDRENFVPDHVFRSTEEIKTPDKPTFNTYGTPLDRNLIAGLKADRFEWDMPATGTPERKSKELNELVNQGTISFRLTQGLLPARIEYMAQQTLYPSQLYLSLPIRELLSPEDVEQFRQQLGKKDSRTVQSELIELIRNSPLLEKKQQEINKFVSEQITEALRNPSKYLQKVCGYPHDTGLSGIDWYNLFYNVVEGKFGVETVQPGMFKEYIPGLKREDLEKAYAHGKDLRATAGTNS